MSPSGKIGPPKLIIKQKEQQIIADIYHPLKAVDGKELESMYDEETCYVFSYVVYMIKDGNEVCLIFVFKMKFFLLPASCFCSSYESWFFLIFVKVHGWYVLIRK